MYVVGVVHYLYFKMAPGPKAINKPNKYFRLDYPKMELTTNENAIFFRLGRRFFWNFC